MDRNGFQYAEMYPHLVRWLQDNTCNGREKKLVHLALLLTLDLYYLSFLLKSWPGLIWTDRLDQL